MMLKIAGHLFLQSLLSLPYGLVNKISMAAGIEVMPEISNMNFHLPELSGYSHCKSRDQYGTIPWGDQTVTWHQVDYIGLQSSWKRQRFVLIDIGIHSGYGFAFPACNTSAKANMWIYRMTYPPLEYSVQHCLWLKNIFYGQRQWVSCSWNSLVLPHSAPSRSICIHRTVERLFGDAVIAPARWL